MADVKELLEKTNRQLSFFLGELKSGRAFDMAGFDTLVAEIQQGVAALDMAKAREYESALQELVKQLDVLQAGLLEKRSTVKGEIESLNRQLSANMAYRKTDTQQ